MPYIHSKRMRTKLNAQVKVFLNTTNGFTGNLNYFLFKLAKLSCHSYMEYRDFIGELEAAKLEIYRRQIAPYEDKKKEENGDVE